MTWNELKEAISNMPESELNKDVKVWGESVSLTDVSLEKASDNMYYHDDFDGECCPEYNLEDYKDDPDTYLVCEKGFHYLWAE